MCLRVKNLVSFVFIATALFVHFASASASNRIDSNLGKTWTTINQCNQFEALPLSFLNEPVLVIQPAGNTPDGIDQPEDCKTTTTYRRATEACTLPDGRRGVRDVTITTTTRCTYDANVGHCVCRTTSSTQKSSCHL